ncbi:MAG: thrombospondin type 3 repeat-containing protein [Saprospiraceae bacterium]
MNRLLLWCCTALFLLPLTLHAQDCCPVYVKRGQDAFNRSDFTKALGIWQSAKSECNDLNKCPELNSLIDKAKAEIKDTDGDGIRDKDDECKSQPGPRKTNGCPDTDGDGIADSRDACPNAAGSRVFDGCPDTDDDGTPDDKDGCPREKGSVSFGGCPTPTATAYPITRTNACAKKARS